MAGESSVSWPARLAVIEERQDTQEKAIDGLTATMSKLMWTLVGFAFTVAGSSVLVAITIASSNAS